MGSTYFKKKFLHDVIEGQMAEVKGVRRRTQLLDDFRNKKAFGAEGESCISKKMETTVYHPNIRKSYKLSSIITRKL